MGTHQKTIAVIYTGGTVGMVQGTDGVLRPLQDPETLLNSVPELGELAKIDLRVLCNLDSSDISPQHWLKLRDLILREKNKYTGFVILHGTDTMAYTASALSFLLAEVDVPVIITGAQLPLQVLRTDARTNIINAVELATKDIPEVAVLFGAELWRGNRTRKISNDLYNAFDSPNYPPLARLGLHVFLFRNNFLQDKRVYFKKAKFADRVFLFRLFPGMNSDIFTTVTPERCQAIIVQGFGVGNIPLSANSLWQWLQSHLAAGTVVAIASQSPRGRVDLSMYENGRKAQDMGILSCQDMTIETSIIKMMLLCGGGYNRQQVAEIFATPLVGEVSSS